jgi:putative membrane protein
VSTSQDDAEGTVEPDPRITFANERTLLAWMRTSLALVAGGLAVTQLTETFDLPGGRRLVGATLIVTGGVLAVLSHRTWRARERALAAGEPVTGSSLTVVVTGIVVAAAVLALVVTVSGAG